MLYFQLFDKKLSGVIGEACGSDSILPIDGRKSYYTAMLWAAEHTFRPNIRGYQLRKSHDIRYSNSHALSEIVPL